LAGTLFAQYQMVKKKRELFLLRNIWQAPYLLNIRWLRKKGNYFCCTININIFSY